MGQLRGRALGLSLTHVDGGQRFPTGTGVPSSTNTTVPFVWLSQDAHTHVTSSLGLDVKDVLSCSSRVAFAQSTGLCPGFPHTPWRLAMVVAVSAEL